MIVDGFGGLLVIFNMMQFLDLMGNVKDGGNYNQIIFSILIYVGQDWEG